MSLGITSKAHRALDILAGLAIGWYRMPTGAPEPERNPNANYIKSDDAARASVEAASSKPLVLSAYPLIFWASRLLAEAEAPRVCDFGGAYGELYFRLTRYRPGIRYTVTEISEIVTHARTLPFLHPVTFSTEATECDLFISSGVVMNAHKPLFAAIERLKPPALLLSSVEVTEEPTFWSTVVMRKHGRRCPYVTFNRSEFIDRISSMGYALKDEWIQGENTSGAFLNFRANPIARGFAFIRAD